MITIELKDDAIERALDGIARALADMTPLMDEIGEILVASTKDRFKAGQGPDGTAWAPKSDTTLAAYKKRGDKADPRPLIGPSGRLSNEILSFPGPDRVEVGSNLIYAAVMQMGAAQGEFGAFIGKDKLGRDHFHTIPWGNIPARPFLGLADEDRTSILGAIGDWLEEAARGG